jgi:hypothetical protein
MVNEMIEDFNEMMNDAKFSKYEEYIQSESKEIKDDVSRHVEHSAKLRDFIFKNMPEIKEKIKKIQQKNIDKAQQELHQEKAIGAVDGSVVSYPVTAGVKCRIGVIAATYMKTLIKLAKYITTTQITYLKDPLEFFEKAIAAKSVLSNLAIRSMMLYKEREVAVNLEEKFKFVHGPFLPWELRSGRLKFKNALNVSLELGRKMVKDKRIIAVVSDSMMKLDPSTTEDQLLPLTTMGNALLNPYEYMVANPSRVYWEKALDESHFNQDDETMVRDFLKEIGDQLVTGVYKVGAKSYVFEAHECYLEKAVSFIMADASNQRLRGFPLLIDYADKACHRFFDASSFNKMVEASYISAGGITGIGDVSERRTR